MQFLGSAPDGATSDTKVTIRLRLTASVITAPCRITPSSGVLSSRQWGLASLLTI